MRLSLDPNGDTFKRQVAALRQHLDSQHMAGGQAAVSARMMVPTLVPYLTVLRTELRDEVVPPQVMTGAADLLANIALATVQSIIEAPPLAEAEMVEQLLTHAIHIACQSIAQQPEDAKPKLSVVPPHPADTVIHMKTKGH